MSAELFNIRKYDDSIELSTLLELYNHMARYLDPGAIELTEEYASLLLSNTPDLSNYSLVFENKQNEIIGFVLIMQFPLDKDTEIWYAQYGIIPKYFKSELPGDLIEATLKLGIKLNIPELYIQTTGELSAPFDNKIEILGFKPIHYYIFMSIDDLDLVSPPDIPQGIIIRRQKEITDNRSIVSVINKGFKDSFMWRDVKPSIWKRRQQSFKKSHIVEYAVAYDKEEVIGFIQSYFDPNKPNIGLMNTLSVLPNYRRRGIGSALFATGVEFLRDKGCKTINLLVDAKNEKAARIYEKFGFYWKENSTIKTYKLR
ncbi:MAG: GNAT family N-acetyltransferase [Candidatus Lokiarchaeota archaeon]|nr:GNAT family N-acetyltransferase [Candidatus Lokiarchaeota archaeon]